MFTTPKIAKPSPEQLAPRQNPSLPGIANDQCAWSDHLPRVDPQMLSDVSQAYVKSPLLEVCGWCVSLLVVEPPAMSAYRQVRQEVAENHVFLESIGRTHRLLTTLRLALRLLII
jgi:hypothetical protein